MVVESIEAQVVDDTHLRLLKPTQLPRNTRVTILLSTSEDGERAAWLRASTDELGRAFSDDEPEYPAKLIKEPNPEYSA